MEKVGFIKKEMNNKNINDVSVLVDKKIEFFKFSNYPYKIIIKTNK